MIDNNKDNKNIFIKIFEWYKRFFCHPITTFYAELKQEQKDWQKIKIEKSFKPFSFETNDDNITFKFNFLTKWHKDFCINTLKIFIILVCLPFCFHTPNFLLSKTASLCADLKQYEQAEKLYYSLIKYEAFIYNDKDLHKINPKYLNELANIYFLQKDYNSAINCYKEILRIYSYHNDRFTSCEKIPIYIKMGDLYYLLNNSKSQYEMYKNAVDISNQICMVPKNSIFDLVIRKKMIGENN